MRLKVKDDAAKGFWVRGTLIPPGAQLPGDWPAVPSGATDRLEVLNGAGEQPDPLVATIPPGGGTSAEIAAIVGEPEPAVRMRLVHAKRRQLVANDGGRWRRLE